MVSRVEFMSRVGLQPTGQRQSKRARNIPLKIDLARTHGPPCLSNFPPTPCSMLSPLSPRVKPNDFSSLIFTESPDDPESPQDDSKLDRDTVLHLIDLASPLGQRIIKILEDLIPESHGVNPNYEQLCGTTRSVEPTDMPRVLRSFNVGGDHSLYQMRYYHRNLNRPHFLTRYGRLERRDDLETMATGLNRQSRLLLKTMKKCWIVLARLSLSSSKFQFSNSIDPAKNRAESDQPVASATNGVLKHCFVMATDCEKNSSMLRPRIHHHQVNHCHTLCDPTTPKASRWPQHRKSNRLRKPPKRLLHSY